MALPVQPRAGVGLIENHIELLKHLQDEGGADLLQAPSTPIPARTSMKTVLRVSDVKKRAWQAANSIHTSTASRQLTMV